MWGLVPGRAPLEAVRVGGRNAGFAEVVRRDSHRGRGLGKGNRPAKGNHPVGGNLPAEGNLPVEGNLPEKGNRPPGGTLPAVGGIVEDRE